jgi:hypothetical protein
MNFPSKSSRLSAVVLLLTTHPLPAPIHETAATPTPKPAQAAKPKPKQPVEPKSKFETDSQIIPPSALRKTGPYAGTWTGIIHHGVSGDRENTIVIDETQTTMKVSDVKRPSGHTFSGPALVGSGGISAALGLTGGTWTLKPYPDGKTAQVKLKAAYYESSAVFRREK